MAPALKTPAVLQLPAHVPHPTNATIPLAKRTLETAPRCPNAILKLLFSVLTALAPVKELIAKDLKSVLWTLLLDARI